VAALIAAQRDEHQIPHTVACRALGVSRSWYYKWASHARAGTLPPRAARRARLAAEVRRLFEAHEGRRGSPMITAGLKDAGWRVSKNTVAALMAEQGLAARPRRRRRATTRPGRGRWRAPDLVKRQFPAARLNHKWYGDGTEIATGEGKLYLASVMDAAWRRILGFTVSGHHDAAAAYGALAMAITMRGGQVPGVIMHTDQGSEYTARAFQAACQRLGIAQSTLASQGPQCGRSPSVVARSQRGRTNQAGTGQPRACRCSRAVIAPSRGNHAASWSPSGSLPGAQLNTTQ
jgi:putative transposase